MRIIAGEFRSRKLHTPPDAEVTRPIPDRVKESVFMLLRGHIEGSEIFDAFAGTGAIGLEALSRGARRVVFVEQNRQIAQVLRRNIEMLGVEDRCELVQSDALGTGALARCPSPVRLAFFDPPYPLARDVLGWKRIVQAMQTLAPNLTDDGFLILRTPWPFDREIHADAPVSAEAARPAKKWNKPRKGESRRSPRDWERGDEDAPPRRPPHPLHQSGGRRGDTKNAPEAWEEIELDELSLESLGEEAVLGEAAAAGPVPGTGASDPDAPKPPAREKIELAIPGLRGPETHVYRHTAVHLYMRA